MMIETLRLKNIAVFIQTIISFVLPRKIIQITLVNILKLLWNLMIKRITNNINVFATRKKIVIFCCYTISRVNTFISRRQTFRVRNFTYASARTCEMRVLKTKVCVQLRLNLKHQFLFLIT